SFICIIFFGLAAFEENYSREWRTHQAAFKKILETNAGTPREKESAADFPIEIRQVILKDFNTVDRCVSCHVGIDNPRMKDEALPYRPHSGDYLKHHPVESFGCTVCHGGQGRGLNLEEAFAREETFHWEFPVIPLEYIQSSCGKCHLSVFNDATAAAGTGELYKGRDIFLREGCLSCHKVRGTGGTFSVDLTDQGTKTRHQYSFQHVEGERNVPNWLKEHFLDPQRVAPGSQMMKFDIEDQRMEALVTFTMGLFTPKLPVKYYSADIVRDIKSHRPQLEGKESYLLFCAVCHGKNGEGKDYRIYEIGIPSLNNQDFLAAASEDMLEFTIENGRTGRMMSPWAPHNSGLSDAEISGMVTFIKNWKKPAPSFEEMKAADGDAHTGKILYRSRCGTCHGANGEGGLGLALNNQNFLSLASDRFIYRTITDGRANTAMPSWSRLSAKQLAGLMAFIRDWQRKPAVVLSSEPVTGDEQHGETLFASMCTGCHGKYGQGGVGPAILNRDFLAAASDAFILESIAGGRKDTAMIAWSEKLEGLARLSPRDIKDVTAFMRSRADWKPDAIYTDTSLGVPSKGKVLYEQMCSGCHGRNGEGKHAPALNNREFLNGATNGFMQAVIALGRSGTAMRSWARGAQGYAELSGGDIDDIVAYIRTWQKSIIKMN
ncbi:MAG: c-type cytochrome, partial [bacterium]|nr:c-type cytochrome [bacterium]